MLVQDRRVLEARQKNFNIAVNEEVQKLMELRKRDLDIFVILVNGDLYEEARQNVLDKQKQGLFDLMFMPSEFNR